jgi:hypothetical protein
LSLRSIPTVTAKQRRHVTLEGLEERHEINIQINAKHVAFLDREGTNGHRKFSYKNLSVGSVVKVRAIIPLGISLGSMTVCSTVYGPGVTGQATEAFALRLHYMLSGNADVHKINAYASSQTSKRFCRSLIRPNFTDTSAYAPSYP